MKKKWLHRSTEELNRSDGVAIIALVVLMLMMTIMGASFASIMGGWKISSPYAINSNRASQLANAAATYALQDSKRSMEAFVDVVCGQSTNVVPVIDDDGNGGNSYYWIELPTQDGVTLYSDDTTGTDPDADDYDDDADDLSNPDLYTIMATGKVVSGGVTVAKRQIKVFVEFPGATITTNNFH